MSKYAVCIHTAANTFALWVTVKAKNAQDAVEEVRGEYAVHDVVGVYQEVAYD